MPMSELRYQFLPNTAESDAEIILLPVAYEKALSSKPGTALAPEAILQSSEQIEFYDETLCWSPMKSMRISVHPLITNAPAEDESLFHARLMKFASGLPGTAGEKLFVALGGDHSITPSLTDGRLPPASTVIFLDAHADLRTTYQGSTYSHACPAHRLRAQDHRLIMIGIRSLFEDEAERIDKDPSIEIFSAEALQHQAQLSELLERLSSIQGPTWLTIDMDVFDPASVPGVSTPQPGGLGWYQVLDIIKALFLRSEAVIYGADIVELVPEPSEVSQITAAKLLQKIISCWGISNGHDRNTGKGSQLAIDYE